MNRLIRIELLKLRTIRLPYGLLAAAAGLSILVGVLAAVRAGSAGVASVATAGGLTNVLTATGLATLMASVLGVIVSSGEFRHKTATVTYLGSPKRVRVLMAKAIAAGSAGLVFGAVGAVITTGIGLAFVAGHGYPLAISAATIARFACGAVAGSGLMAAAGAGIGALIRSQLGAVITVFAWCMIIESILGGVFSSVARYLPFTAATTLAGAKAGGGSFGYAGTAGTAALPFIAAAVLVAGVAVIILAIAALTTVRRDIL